MPKSLKIFSTCLFSKKFFIKPNLPLSTASFIFESTSFSCGCDNWIWLVFDILGDLHKLLIIKECLQ